MSWSRLPSTTFQSLSVSCPTFPSPFRRTVSSYLSSGRWSSYASAKLAPLCEHHHLDLVPHCVPKGRGSARGSSAKEPPRSLPSERHARSALRPRADRLAYAQRRVAASRAFVGTFRRHSAATRGPSKRAPRGLGRAEPKVRIQFPPARSHART